MTVTTWVGGWLRGLSGDTKPSPSGFNGYNFLETDTGDIYYSNGSTWAILSGGASTTQTLTNKTININQNTVKDSTTNALGDLLKSNGTQFDRFPRGTFNQVLRVDRKCQDVEWGVQYMNMLPNVKKHGYWYGNHVDAWNGIFAGGITKATGETPALGTDDATHGLYQSRTTGATIGNNAGWRFSTLFTQRSYNPKFVAKFKLAQTTAQRLFIGLTSLAGSEPGNTDDAYSVQHVAALSLRAADTVFQWARNDGAGATAFTEVANSPAVDTAVHTVEIRGDEPNAQWILIFDNNHGSEQVFTTNMPGSTDRLGIHFFVQTTASATKRMDQYWCGVESDN